MTRSFRGGWSVGVEHLLHRKLESTECWGAEERSAVGRVKGRYFQYSGAAAGLNEVSQWSAVSG